MKTIDARAWFTKNSPGELSALHGELKLSKHCYTISLAWHLNTCAYNWRYVIEMSYHKLNVQVNLIITLSLGSMKTDRVISEPCYNEVIYNRHIVK